MHTYIYIYTYTPTYIGIGSSLSVAMYPVCCDPTLSVVLALSILHTLLGNTELAAGTRFACFTSASFFFLSPCSARPQHSALPSRQHWACRRYSIYLLYWF